MKKKKKSIAFFSGGDLELVPTLEIIKILIETQLANDYAKNIMYESGRLHSYLNDYGKKSINMERIKNGYDVKNENIDKLIKISKNSPNLYIDYVMDEVKGRISGIFTVLYTDKNPIENPSRNAIPVSFHMEKNTKYFANEKVQLDSPYVTTLSLAMLSSFLGWLGSSELKVRVDLHKADSKIRSFSNNKWFQLDKFLGKKRLVRIFKDQKFVVCNTLKNLMENANGDYSFKVLDENDPLNEKAYSKIYNASSALKHSSSDFSKIMR